VCVRTNKKAPKSPQKSRREKKPVPILWGDRYLDLHDKFRKAHRGDDALLKEVDELMSVFQVWNMVVFCNIERGRFMEPKP
jgi:hypothetical protein